MSPLCALHALATISVLSALAGWGADNNPEDGSKLIESVRPELAAILKAPEAQRAALARAFVAKRGDDAIEALKRFRNSELKPVFLELLRQEDWHLRHRALLALEYYGGADVLQEAFALLEHPEARLREKAAITCLKLWDPKALPKADKALPGLAAREVDPHVRACLQALQRRIKGKLSPLCVGPECVQTLEDGLKLTPYLELFSKLAQVAPGFKPAATMQTGGGRAEKLPDAERWIEPVLGMGREEVPGDTQPFANLRQGGTVYHTGWDVNACMDGSGFYAAADGVVVLLSTGTDMGTMLVLQHSLGEGLVVNLIYMHGGDAVFVKPRETVACGQLIGTMGLGCSAENGGHFAHLHVGLYPGPFNIRHNYGYHRTSVGLADWLDPEAFLKRRVAWSQPVAPEALPAEVLERAVRQRDDGWPQEALEFLKRHAPKFKLDQAVKDWKADPAVKKALAGEPEVLAAEGHTVELLKQKDGRAKVKALWEGLLAKYTGTCLEPRIRERLKYP